MRELERFGGFRARAGRAQNGLAVVFDLEGFSRFFNQPDVHDYIPVYLNKVLGEVENCFLGGKAPDDEEIPPLKRQPIHRKFLGDGMLYVWSLEGLSQTDISSLVGNVCNRLWNLKIFFKDVNRACSDFVPLLELPQRIRFGVGRGTIYELSIEHSSSKEYIGICINLASRLQSYCAHLGFVASARLALRESDLSKHGYIKVVATKIKGFPKEIVIVDKAEFSQLPKDLRDQFFQDL